MSKSSVRLSVVYATYNEEEQLARSLDSIKDLADEIIVVDGESSDATVAIAKQYGAKVISTTNKPIFHINKQMAMDAAVGEWVLQMDADEVVDQEMCDHIRQIIANTSQNSTSRNSKAKADPVAYWLRRRNWYLNRFLRKGGQYPDPVIRFYRRGYAHLPMKSVHEQMVVDGEIGSLRGHLLHYNAPTFADALRKSNTYSSLAADFMAEQKIALNALNAWRYLCWQPLTTFGLLYFRHKGFMDGFAGFVFAVMSGWYHAVAYIKYWEKQQLVKDRTGK